MSALDILIVDDEAELAEQLKFTFEQVGHNVTILTDGEQALDALKDSLFDIVLSDIRMPALDGIGLLDELVASNFHVPPVVLVSAYSYISDEEAYEKGACGVVSKPFDPQGLFEMVERYAVPCSVKWKKSYAPVGFKDELEPTGEFEGRLPSLDLAGKHHVINLAKGGMFLRAADDAMPDLDELVRFDFEFENGNVSSLKGLGRVKWVRPNGSTEYPSGCGVEILRLDDSCLKEVVEEIEQSKVKAFIPRT
jgi:CheY-like chemotaxis protein